MIRVDSTTNPRQTIDEDRLAELARSIENNGLLTALTVEPIIETEGAEPVAYALVAGHRRLLALDAINGTEDFIVPAIVNGTEKDVAAVIENVVREELTATEEALAYRKLIDGGMTDRGIADRLGVDLKRVRARLEILDLPPEVVAWVGEGSLPPSTIKNLLKIAKHHTGLAIAVAKEAKGKADYQGVLAKRPQDLVAHVATKSKSGPWVFYPCELGIDRIRQLFPPDEHERSGPLLTRLKAFSTDSYQATVRLVGDSGYERLKGAGVLIPTDAKNGQGVVHTVDDTLLDLIELVIADKEQIRATNAKRAAEAKARKAGVDPTADDATQAAQKEAESKARKQMAERAREDRGHNLTLGRKLQLDRVSRDDDAAVRLICLELLSALRLGHVAKAGLRLVIEQLQQVEVTKPKNGGPAKEKVTYLASIKDCEDAARKWVLAAETTDDLFHRTMCVLLAAEGALQTAVAESARSFPSLSRDGEALELRRKLVDPYIAGGPHTARVQRQWKAIDEAKTDSFTGGYVFPAGLHLVGDEGEQMAEEGQPPSDETPPDAA